MRRLLPFLAVLAVAVSACGGDDRKLPDDLPDSGIEGVALVGPQCPVEREGTPCPDEPLPDARIDVKDRGTGEVVATVTTDAEGRFRIALEPGEYTLEGVPVEGRPLPFAKPIDVTVPAGRFIEVTVSFDSGIR